MPPTSAMVAAVKLPPEKVEERPVRSSLPRQLQLPAQTVCAGPSSSMDGFKGGGQSGRRPRAAPEGERCIPLPLHVLRRQGSGRVLAPWEFGTPQPPALF